MLDASKRGQMRRKGAYSEADLLTVARKLHSAPNMKFRVPGQRRGVLAVMGPQPAEQVVLILGTGSGKTLVFQVGAMVADARTTILILPAVVLRGDMLRRCQLVGIQPLIWSVGCKRSSSLVIMSAEAACTEGFLEYAHTLVRGQGLDRIVVDESQLTITASDYRPCMSQLGWYVRQIRTQTVWLTATLPPVMQEEFIEQNKLVRPTIIRESTNRPNIKYLISLEDGSGTLLEKAATLVRTCWPRRDIFDHAKDKIIIYCRTRLEVRGLQELLGCASYMSESGSEEEKREIINGWLGDVEQPAIVATSALGIGFDYAHVRWVIHVDAPDKMTDFSQESGRAGRDGRAATSIVMIRSHWKPQSGGNESADKEAMQLYLARLHCCRGVLSQFLDQKADWRWCMEGEEPCQICGKGQREARPFGLEFKKCGVAREEEWTGPKEVLRQDHMKDEALDRYQQDLEAMRWCCLYCRAQGRKFDHMAKSCAGRFEWMRAKKEAYERGKQEGRGWIAPYVACWKCYQPQGICRVADPDHGESECQFPDIVIPVCYGVFRWVGGEGWLEKHFKRKFNGEEEYMRWLGETGSLRGNECIQANCVAAVAMEEFQ